MPIGGACPLCSESGCEQLQQTTPLFDHLVGAGEQSWRHGQTKRLRSDQVDDQIELGLVRRRPRARGRSLGPVLPVGALTVPGASHPKVLILSDYI
jgi:hypothetical protein